MTDQEIIIEVAKLAEDCVFYDEIHNTYFKVTATGRTTVPRPLYDQSRDAIIPVIEKHMNTKDDVWNFCVNLSKILTETDEDYKELSPFEYICSTPKQLSIALLKSTGKWEE